MSVLDRLADSVRGKGLAVVLPEGEDERIVAAACRLQHEGVSDPVLLGQKERVEDVARGVGVSLEGIRVVDPLHSQRLDAYVEAYARSNRLEPKIAWRIVKRPLFFAGMMVAQGDAQTMVAGATKRTDLVIHAGVLTVGLADNIATPSSFFLMVLPEFQGRRGEPILFADCAVNVAPTPEQLADIAIAAAISARGLLEGEPRIALLSFSTKGSASHSHVDRVKHALEIVKGKAGDLLIDGELQADAALIPSVAAKKIKGTSPVAGRANVLVFPDLNSGNIAYKLTERLAGARAIGPILQGFAKPLSDLSRGAAVDDIVATATVCLAQVG